MDVGKDMVGIAMQSGLKATANVRTATREPFFVAGEIVASGLLYHCILSVVVQPGRKIQASRHGIPCPIPIQLWQLAVLSLKSSRFCDEGLVE